MCTAVTYKTKNFYMGRTLDYEFSYGEEVTITPRNYTFKFKMEIFCLGIKLLLTWHMLTFMSWGQRRNSLQSFKRSL